MKTWITNCGKIFLTLSVVSFVGCDGNNGPVKMPAAGTYGGFLQVIAAGQPSEYYVTGKVTQGSSPHLVQGGFTYQQTADTTSPSHSFNVSVDTSSGSAISVGLPGLTTAKMTASWDKNSQCFLSNSTVTAATQSRLCVGSGAQEISIDFVVDAANEYILVVDIANAEGSATPVAPKVYSFADVITKASTQNFQTQIQYEQTQLSKLAALSAKLKLVPGGESPSSILGLVQSGLSWNTVIDAIGVFVPFLLPSRWIEAGEAQTQLQADKYAYVLMRLNTANTAEGAAWALLRDKAGLATLKTYETPVKNIDQAVHDAAEFGIETPDAVSQMDTVVANLQAAEDVLAEAIDDDKAAIAQIMGFSNPDAVIDVTPPPGLPALVMPNLPPIDTLDQQAWGMSFEKLQADALYQVAGDQYKDTFYSWIDPQGGSPGLGANLPVSIAASKENKAMILTEEQSQNQTFNFQLRTITDGLGTALTNYTDDQKELTLQQQIIQDDQDLATQGKHISGSVLESAFQQAMQYELSRDTEIYAFYTNLGNLNRMMLQGVYGTIASQNPFTPSPAPAPTAKP